MRAIRELLSIDRRFPGLIVEVTEDDIIKDPELIREIATQLKIYNVRISIDDFGSAYSSLSRLLELPCVELKLDRSFVANCSADPQKQTLCRTVIDLAHQFNASVCAEGVETADDLRALIAMGCDVAQGFLFARPMTLGPFAKTLTAQPTHSTKLSSETPSAGATLAALRS
jgi:EAL domain-containing protein (putative c-di-GMP-specific phosphodiesterase class I)